MKTIATIGRIVAVCCLFTAMTFNTFAQEWSFPTKNLYTVYGQPKTCEDNFKSLFKAWNKDNISNPDEFKLVSYKSLGTIQDEAQANKYLMQMTSLDYPFLSLSGGTSTTKDGKKMREAVIRAHPYAQMLKNMPADKKDEAQAMITKRLTEMREHLAQYVKPGYEAYSVMMDNNGKILEYIVVCNPESKQVIADNVFKNINVISDDGSIVVPAGTLFAKMPSKPAKPIEQITLYTLAGMPQTCEDNLKNLLSVINTPGGSIDNMMTYKSLGKVKDSQIENYLDAVAGIGAPIYKGKITFTKDNAGIQQVAETSVTSLQIMLDAAPNADKAALNNKYGKQVAEKKAKLREQLKPGLEAFSVQSKLGDKPIEYFVFCDPATKEVVVDPNFKNITLVFKQAE